MATDVIANASFWVYFLPIAGFLLVFVVLYALLAKTKILGENTFVQLFVPFIIASLFVSFVEARQYVQMVIPWFVILVISAFMLLALLGFIGKIPEGMSKGIGVAFLVLLAIVFLVSIFIVFSNIVGPYLPWNSPTNVGAEGVHGSLYTPRTLGAIVLIVLAALVSWVLVKAGK